MLICEATDSIKRFCNQETAAGDAMDPAMLRDHVLWGDVDRACTGISPAYGIGGLTWRPDALRQWPCTQHWKSCAQTGPPRPGLARCSEQHRAL